MHLVLLIEFAMPSAAVRSLWVSWRDERDMAANAVRVLIGVRVPFFWAVLGTKAGFCVASESFGGPNAMRYVGLWEVFGPHDVVVTFLKITC